MALIAVQQGARSHLAAKSILVLLAQVFGGAGFTSRTASSRLGLDFLYVSKELSRMAKRPDYYLKVVRRVPRPIGGFENVYVISQRGWNKINYYRAHSPLPPPKTGKTLWNSMCDAGFLLYGKGLPSEVVVVGPILKWLGLELTEPTLLDDLGQVLVTMDKDRAPVEAFLTDSPLGKELLTINRTLYLQKTGLIQNNVNVPLYLLHNQLRGIRDETSVIALLIRRGLELRDALAAWKALYSATERNRTPTSETDHQETLLAEKKRNELESEIALLKSELADARLEKYTISLQNDNLRNHILNTSRLLTTISEEMKKIKNPSFDALAIKSIVYTGLTGIAAANYLTFTQNKSNA